MAHCVPQLILLIISCVVITCPHAAGQFQSLADFFHVVSPRNKSIDLVSDWRKDEDEEDGKDDDDDTRVKGLGSVLGRPIDNMPKDKKCEDFCPLFTSKCKAGWKCVTTSDCRMVCRSPSGTEVSLSSKDKKDEEKKEQLRPESERLCNDSGKLCVHGTCENGYDCMCDPGYEGELCTDKECDISCDHGVCRRISPDGESVRCVCDEGWVGAFCNVRCTLDCVNGGSCRRSFEPESRMFCSCPFQFTGQRCEERKITPLMTTTGITKVLKPETSKDNGRTELRSFSERYCILSGKVCVHGTCANGQSCVCDLGYEGEQCADLECELPCENGVCRRLNPHGSRAKCFCQPGWVGYFCDVSCTLNCANNGVCKRSNEDPTRMYCNCPYQFTGERCERRTDVSIEESGQNLQTSRALSFGITISVLGILGLMLSFGSSTFNP